MPLDMEYLLLKKQEGINVWHAWHDRGHPNGLNYNKPQIVKDELSELTAPFFCFLPDKISSIALALDQGEYLVIIKSLLPTSSYTGPITMLYAVFNQPPDDYTAINYRLLTTYV